MIFISFEIDNLKVLRKLNKDINIQYLNGIEDNKKKEEVIKYCKELKLDADVYYDNITKEFIDNCHKNNINEIREKIGECDFNILYCDKIK